MGFAVIPVLIWLNISGLITIGDQSWILAIIQAVLVSFVLVVFQLMYAKTTDSINQFYKGLLESYRKYDK